MILGNDISRYQGNIDFAKMKAAGSRFVYIRIGVGYTKDQNYEVNKAGAKAAGIPWGSYWLPWATSTTQKLLNTYFAMVGEDWGDIPPAIDVETDGLGLGIFIMWAEQVAKAWLTTLPANVDHIRTLPTFYTRASHFDGYTNAKNIKQQLGKLTNLWDAHYTYDPINKPPNMPRDSWTDYLIHQYSADENSLGSKYGVSSKAIDMDYFNGDEALFAQWAGVEESTPDIPPVVNPPVSSDIEFRLAELEKWNVLTKKVLADNIEAWKTLAKE